MVVVSIVVSADCAVSAVTESMEFVSAGMLSTVMVSLGTSEISLLRLEVISEHLQSCSTLAQAGDSLLPMQELQNSMQVSFAKEAAAQNKKSAGILYFNWLLLIR